MNSLLAKLPVLGGVAAIGACLFFYPGVGLMILALMMLILVHEFGHWIVARMCGMQTPVFSIGFGKREWSIILGRFWETEFRISPVMLGGYVAIPELNDESSFTEIKKAYKLKEMRVFPVWQRLLVAVAGVVMNVITAFVIFASLLFFMGKPAPEITSVNIKEFPAGYSVAQDAGFEVGDKFVSIDGTQIKDPQNLIDAISSKPNQEITVVVDRSGNQVIITVTPNADGKIGIAIGADFVMKYEKQSFGTSLSDGIKQTAQGMIAMPKGIAMMAGWIDPPEGTPDGATDVRGVVGIVQIGADAWEQGIFQFWFMVAMISINLAFMNILPIPMLDGGHIVFFTIEGIRGKPVNPEIQARLSSIFLFLLLGLTFWGLYNDIFNPIKMP